MCLTAGAIPCFNLQVKTKNGMAPLKESLVTVACMPTWQMLYSSTERKRCIQGTLPLFVNP
jgi:hypothetical protein